MSQAFSISDEQQAFRAMVRRFIESNSNEAAVRAQMDSERGFDPAVWSAMAGQLGLQGLIVPEAFGGQGFGALELGIVLEEMGRALLCAPYFSTVVLATHALLLAGDADAQAKLLPGIARGETVATVALAEPDALEDSNGVWTEAGIQMHAEPKGDGWTLSGTKVYVIDGHVADVVLVAARTRGGVSLFHVPGDAHGLGRTRVETLDRTRKQARLDFDSVSAAMIGEEGGAWVVLAKLLDRVAIALAAEQAGGAQRCLEMAVEYAKDRHQFGRPIGSFQAIKHKCADMLLEVESARSAAQYASWCASESADELPRVAAAAKAYCSEAHLIAASENIQIHGGIGFTWEHPAHLYFRRAKSNDLLFGDAAYQRELLAQRIGL